MSAVVSVERDGVDAARSIVGRACGVHDLKRECVRNGATGNGRAHVGCKAGNAVSVRQRVDAGITPLQRDDVDANASSRDRGNDAAWVVLHSRRSVRSDAKRADSYAARVSKWMVEAFSVVAIFASRELVDHFDEKDVNGDACPALRDVQHDALVCGNRSVQAASDCRGRVGNKACYLRAARAKRGR